MKTTGAFRERLREAWIELKENPGRSFLQALGVMLGVRPQAPRRSARRVSIPTRRTLSLPDGASRLAFSFRAGALR